jgi:hypothetical protein
MKIHYKSYNKFIHKLKSAAFDIREDKRKFQNKNENNFVKSFNTHERRLINAGIDINQVRALTVNAWNEFTAIHLNNFFNKDK